MYIFGVTPFRLQGDVAYRFGYLYNATIIVKQVKTTAWRERGK